MSRAVAGAALLDLAVVVAFAATGRASHDSDVLGGLWMTAWPFLVGLVGGWLIARAWRRPLTVIRTGIPVWLSTVVIGMLLRAVSGQGTAVAFIVVATLTLGLLLIGWRSVVALVVRARTRRASGSSRP
ncbi:DUF3054 domain-containing protein [Microbacterium sp. CJ88]|uniref:DUF3054 domain-containing protein n=1 Tax=Microbacterium sp. CJ88 TaxID=3445672 RepID=UPI003F65CEA5